MDIISVQIPLESIPSANDHSTAASYEYVHPEIHGTRWGSYACSWYRWESFKKKGLNQSPAKSTFSFISHSGSFQYKNADSQNTHLNAFQFNCKLYCPCECCVPEACRCMSFILNCCKSTEYVLMHYIPRRTNHLRFWQPIWKKEKK